MKVSYSGFFRSHYKEAVLHAANARQLFFARVGENPEEAVSSLLTTPRLNCGTMNHFGEAAIRWFWCVVAAPKETERTVYFG